MPLEIVTNPFLSFVVAGIPYVLLALALVWRSSLPSLIAFVFTIGEGVLLWGYVGGAYCGQPWIGVATLVFQAISLLIVTVVLASQDTGEEAVE